jgi:hypothetical protein
MGVDGQCHASTALPRERDPVSVVQEAAWAPGPFWTSKENLAPTGIRFPDRPARSQSLYESNSKITNVRYFWRGVTEIKVSYHSRINLAPDGKSNLLLIFPRMARQTLLGQGPPPHYRGFMIILRHTTLGGTPLDEWLTQRRDLYLTTHNTQQETSMPPAGFELAIPASERQRTRTLNRATTICLPVPRLLLICERKSCVRYWWYGCFMNLREMKQLFIYLFIYYYEE